MLHPSFADSTFLGIPWLWIVSVGIGGFIGLAVYMSREDPLNYTGSTAGCFGTILLGIAGAVIGELLLDRLFDVNMNDFVSVTLTAIIGASLAVMVVGARRRKRTESEHG
jgi:uncharacterized membrane protein YeaQ/YmgE (transglycosylase-associated protein family)